MKAPHVRERRGTVAVDFDGVVRSTAAGWHQGPIRGDPIEGTEDALRQLSIAHELVLLTARHNLEDVHLWLVQQHIRQHFKEITNRKPAAIAYLDDRAVRFTDWPTALADLTRPVQ